MEYHVLEEMGCKHYDNIVDVWSTVRSANVQIAESVNDYTKYGDRLIVSGVIQRKDALNQNKRVYPGAILEREMLNYKKKFIDTNTAYGELDHPDVSTVRFQETSHALLDYWWDGNDVMGNILVFNSPTKGGIIREIIESGMTVGISSRGMGSVKEMKVESANGVSTVYEVQDDFELNCFDFVTNPSTHNAFQYRVNKNESTVASSVVESVNKNASTSNLQQMFQTWKSLNG